MEKEEQESRDGRVRRVGTDRVASIEGMWVGLRGCGVRSKGGSGTGPRGKAGAEIMDSD